MNRVPRSVFFLLFTVSGFAGLIYESIWSHYLKLFLGHAAYAQTLVLALFMGGMAAGSWLCSRGSLNWKNLLRGYALAEALIGVAALLFHQTFVAATDSAYANILPALGGETSAALFKWTLAGLLILPQSVLLGMTFPLMSAGLIRRYPAAPGESLAMLYFTNSFGAAIGVLASGFVLIEALGLPGTVQAAGAMNLALAAAVWALAGGEEPAPAAPAAARGDLRGEPSTRLLLAVALLTGAASFAFEIGWIRMLSLVLGSSTHSFELMLSAFILGIACGGYWVRRRIDAIADPGRFLGTVLTVMGLLALATLPLYGQMFGLMQVVIQALARTDAGYALFLLSSHGIALAVMFPATFCAGMTLPLITYTLLRGGQGEKAIGAVYSANTLGSILGVFFAAHVGMPLLGLKGLIACGAALDAGLGLALLWRAGGAQRLRLGAAALSLACFAAVLAGVQLDPYKMASGVFRHGDLYTTREATMLMHRDGKTTTVSLMDFGTDRSLRTNGKSDGAVNMDPNGPRVSDEVTMTLTAAIPLAYRPDAAAAAVIGIGTGLTTHTLLGSSALRSVETIEIEPAMAEASRLFAPRNAGAFADPRSHIVFDDAKSFFSTYNRKYDIVISEPSNPWVSGVSSLFTSEFYRLVRRHLNEDGVLVQWFQMYEIDASLIASVLRALGENFPDYAVYASTGSDLLIVAGETRTLARPLTDLLATLPGVARELRRVQVNSIGDIEARRIGGKSALAPMFLSYGVPANSDYAPYLDLHAAKYRFLHQSADELTGLLSYAVPVVALLEGRKSARADPDGGGQEYLDSLELARRAGYARDYLLASKPPEPVAIPRPFQKDLELARARLIECRDVGRSDIWFHSLYDLARTLNPMLSAADAAAVWDRIGRAPCAAQLTAEERQWIGLFRAVGERSAPDMARIAEALLAQTSDLPPSHRQYLIAAGMAGYLAQGKRAEAATLWNRYPADADRAGDIGLRLLQAHAFPIEQ
ncbi:MAG TPA: fused MFS/spermidine synthase [Burkholderiales bacterium]|nr:fused MFS/spermidine synthase [Burkholderiales bacterium]